MPGLDRLQRPDEDLGGGEAKQAGDQRPQRADRQPEQPPRCPRQARHQRDAGDQHEEGQDDPVHRHRSRSQHRFPRRKAAPDQGAAGG